MIRRSEVYSERARGAARIARGGALTGLALGCWLTACTEPVYEGDDAEVEDESALDAAAAEDATQEPEFDADTEQDAAAGDDSSEAGANIGDATSGETDADTALDAAGDSASSGDASTQDATTLDGGAGALMTQTFSITADEDDAVWYVHPDFDDFRELLHLVPAEHMSSGFTIEVGADGAQARAGLRFRLPIASGAHVLEAKLMLKRMAPDENLPTDTMRVQVFETDDAAPFNGTHYHVKPDDHAASGLWGVSVGNFVVGKAGDTIISPDVSILVQRVVDRPGWRSGGHVGFVLFPEFLGDGFAPLGDSFANQGASLSVTWREP